MEKTEEETQNEQEENQASFVYRGYKIYNQGFGVGVINIEMSFFVKLKSFCDAKEYIDKEAHAIELMKNHSLQ